MTLELEYFFRCSEQDTLSLGPAGSLGPRRGGQGGAACGPLMTLQGADAWSGGAASPGRTRGSLRPQEGPPAQRGEGTAVPGSALERV